MKKILTVFLGLSWVAIASASASAIEQNSRTLSQNTTNPNQTTNQPSGTAADLKPNDREIQAQSMQDSIQEAKTRVERKSLRSRTDRGLANDQPELLAPLCIDPCLPSIGPEDAPPGGVGVQWPLKF